MGLVAPLVISSLAVVFGKTHFKQAAVRVILKYPLIVKVCRPSIYVMFSSYQLGLI